MQILDTKYFNEIETFIEKNNLQSKVKIFTDLENKYLINLYKNAYLYIFSSYSEVFGYTTIEAMASGCPILVSNTSCLPEINGKAAGIGPAHFRCGAAQPEGGGSGATHQNRSSDARACP